MHLLLNASIYFAVLALSQIVGFFSLPQHERRSCCSYWTQTDLAIQARNDPACDRSALFFVMSKVHNATYCAYVRRAFIAYGQTDRRAQQSIADALNKCPDWFTSISDVNAILADCVIVCLRLLVC